MRRTLLAVVLITTTFADIFTEGGSLGEQLYPRKYSYPESYAFIDEPEENYRVPLEEFYTKENSLNERQRDVRDSEGDYENIEEILQALARQNDEQQKQDQTEIPDELEIDNVEEQPLVAQKKGQNEFVSFVEPDVDAKQTKSVSTLEKRRLTLSSETSDGLPKYSSNLLMIAVGTVLIVGIVVSVIGGGYYIKRRRSSTDDSDYAPYAGTGPGFKKNKGDKGDETLAYKAQLHQYQQAKQKIICGEDAPAGLESDAEDDGADDENNYSVYECPGLAPTGDIEVCNPNFAAHP
ncbi:Pantothenate kinase [Parelaphostrongylus tenuis]|uniref:Pantothenate kinase n=1 Tax=Parelaphostrongylus tenuis TaxID=148309 RepID=A0AAD5QU58_PARTN|nr:Pantothenate kinase [Parelaphostrongylus tenuis]